MIWEIIRTAKIISTNSNLKFLSLEWMRLRKDKIKMPEIIRWINTLKFSDGEEFEMKIDNADAEIKINTTIYSVIFLNKFILTITKKESKNPRNHILHEEI